MLCNDKNAVISAESEPVLSMFPAGTGMNMDSRLPSSIVDQYHVKDVTGIFSKGL
jgi:hypothetical protein